MQTCDEYGDGHVFTVPEERNQFGFGQSTLNCTDDGWLFFLHVGKRLDGKGSCCGVRFMLNGHPMLYACVLGALMMCSLLFR